MLKMYVFTLTLPKQSELISFISAEFVSNMAAPKGNNFWKLRSKHGRDRIIQSPEILEEAANEYFQWCIDNPIIQKDYRGKDAEMVYLEHPRVFQKDAFALFCGLAQWRTIEELKAVSKDFMQVVTRIEQAIKTQKFEHAAVGMFNSNIIARDLGLADKQHQQQLDENGNPINPNKHTITYITKKK